MNNLADLLPFPNAWMVVHSHLTERMRSGREQRNRRQREEKWRWRGRRRVEGGEKGPTSLGEISILWRIHKWSKNWVNILGPGWTPSVHKHGNGYSWLLHESIIFLSQSLYKWKHKSVIVIGWKTFWNVWSWQVNRCLWASVVSCGKRKGTME